MTYLLYDLYTLSVTLMASYILLSMMMDVLEFRSGNIKKIRDLLFLRHCATGDIPHYPSRMDADMEVGEARRTWSATQHGLELLGVHQKVP